MGFQTTIIIRNDALDEIRNNPQEFVENMLNAIAWKSKDGLDFAAGCHANVGRVIESHHSDYTTVIASGGSTAEQIASVSESRWPSRRKKLFQLAAEVLCEAEREPK